MKTNENGAALVIVILILMALTAIVMGVSSISVNETQIATNEMLDKRAFYLAEAGAEKSIKYLSQLATPFRGTGTAEGTSRTCSSTTWRSTTRER